MGGGGGGGGGGEHYETTPSLSCPGRPASGQNGPTASLKKAEQDLYFSFFFLFSLFRTPGFQKFMGDREE